MKTPILVFCERIQNESFCEAVVRELSAHYEVRPFGPNWPIASLADVDKRRVRFYLELDSASGEFCHPPDLHTLEVPKFAWFIDTHKKPDFHRQISREMDVTFHAMKNWGHVLEGRTAWLPLHFDAGIFHPVDCERDLDLVFVGSYSWRADPIVRLAKNHGLKVHVECTTGPDEKTETAKLYARTKLVFNRHVTNDLNFRVFEAMACGRVLLTDAQRNGQYELFEDGRHYVLYKDDEDLERLVLRYLRDGAARSEIERAAAELAHRGHSTRARVGQLVQAIEGFLGEDAEGTNTVKEPKSLEKKRWLVFVEDGESYAGRLASALEERGHEVVVARERQSGLPSGSHAYELEAGPVPVPSSLPSRMLAVAGPLHARFARLATEEGPFDVVIGEGALGGLVAAPVAKRTGTPFVLALEACEVEKHENHLTREQLNTAELENWAVNCAQVVVSPTQRAASAIGKFYRTKKVTRVTPGVARRTEAPGAERLLAKLGLESAGYVLVIAGSIGERAAREILAGPPSEATLALASPSGIWLRLPRGEIAKASRYPATGAVLTALVTHAEAVVGIEAGDRRVDVARELGKRVASCKRPERAGAAWLTEAGKTARPHEEPRRDGLAQLEELACVL